MFQPVPPPTWSKETSQTVYGIPQVAGDRPYINPDPLGLVQPILARLGLELGGHEGQHVLAALEEGRPGGVIDARLSLVEGLEGVLLGSLAVAGVRL